jgi:hypothetical protein
LFRVNIPKQNEDAAAGSPEGSQGRQDLSFLWPVIDRIRAVEIKFNGDASADHNGGAAPAGSADVEARLAKLETEIAAIKAVVHNAAGMLTGVQAVASAPLTDSEVTVEHPLRSWPDVAAAVGASIALLMLAHWLIIFVFDLRTVMLLLASIGIPLVVALIFTLNRRIVLRYEAAIALGIALLAVFGMSYVTGRMQDTPWLPQDAREWRETLEYIASISFAYLTGVLVSSAWQARRGRSSGRVGEATLEMAKRVAKVTGQALETGSKVGKQVKTIQDVINAAIPAATAIASVITGIDSVLK